MTERTALYRMFNAADVLLYVGISKDFGRRWKQEAAAMPWWPEVKRLTVEWFDTREDAHAAEMQAVHDEHPVHNKAGVPVHLRQPPPPRPDLPLPPTWTDDERVQAIDQIREILTRPDLSHAYVRLMAANLLTTGHMGLPRGAELALLARSCGVSRSSAFNALAAADSLKRAG